MRKDRDNKYSVGGTILSGMIGAYIGYKYAEKKKKGRKLFSKGGGVKHSYEIEQEGDEFVVEFYKSNGKLDWGKGGFSSREEAEKYALENRTYAEGGAIDGISYDALLNLLKEKLEDSVDDLPRHFENSYEFKGEEVEHKSRDGFIAYTDGGYEVRWFEYLSMFWGAGYGLPTSALDNEKERQIDYSLEMAKDYFKDEYPEIVEELGEDNVDYNSLYEAGYQDEAEELSNAEQDNMDGTIMCEIGAYYYSPENDRGIDGKHTLRLFGLVNLESPYHRSGNLEDRYDIDITFDSIEDLEQKIDEGLEAIIRWFDGDFYNESTEELRIRRMAKGGNVKTSSRSKRKPKQPKLTRFQFEEESYEYAEGGKVAEYWKPIDESSIYRGVHDYSMDGIDDEQTLLQGQVWIKFKSIPKGVTNLPYEVKRAIESDFEYYGYSNTEYRKSVDLTEGSWWDYYIDFQNLTYQELEELLLKLPEQVAESLEEQGIEGYGELGFNTYGNYIDVELSSDNESEEDEEYEYAKGGFVSKGERVWNKMRGSERYDFLYKNFTPKIPPRTQETLKDKNYRFLPKDVKIAFEAEYANKEYAEGGSLDYKKYVITEHQYKDWEDNEVKYEFDSYEDANNKYWELVSDVKRYYKLTGEVETYLINLSGYVEGKDLEYIRHFTTDDYIADLEYDDDDYSDDYAKGGGVSKFPVAIERRINEINELLPKVKEADEIAGGYFGSTHYTYVQLKKPIEIKGKYVYIHSANGKYDMTFEKRYNVNKLGDEIDGRKSLNYDLSNILKAFKSVLKDNYGKGGGIGFKGLSAKVAKRYEGKSVAPKYQSQYGTTYSKSEAKEVGDKVAGKVYWNQQGRKMAQGGLTEHGLKVGDKIERKLDAEGSVIKVKNKRENAYVVLDSGFRNPIPKMANGGGIMADGRIVLRTFNGVGGNKNKTYKLIKDDRDSDGKPYYTLIEDQSGNIMAQGDSFEEVNGYANLMSGKFANGGGVDSEITLYKLVGYYKASDFDNKTNGFVIADDYITKRQAENTMYEWKRKKTYPYIEIKEYKGKDPYKKFANGGGISGIEDIIRG
jgi:hypothetical protein